jgi:MoaA/NifB/PqqE/SkfB family radical SAM enzyme
MTMNESFGELTHPVSIKWELTYNCNMQCLHCGVCGGSCVPHELNTEEALHVCDKIRQSKAITVLFSGGEPLLREDFFLIAQTLHDYNMLLSIESNGWLLDSKTVETLADMQVQYVKVSLDGRNPETHDRLRNFQGSWEKAVRAIKNLIQAGIKTAVGFCPVRFNIAEVERVIDFCVEIGVSQINTGELAPQGRGFTNWDKISLSKEQYNHFFSILDEKSKEYQGNITINYTENIMKNISTQWKAPPAQIIISPSGKIRLSGLLPFVLGSVRDQSINELFMWYKRAWRTEKVKKYLKKIQRMEDFLKYPDEVPFLNYEEVLCE